ncbi:MAG: hypothetical protein A2Y40_06565 [Candidatus Margulisbacteria bacterium GWF2_35_9]|nr:MAG: hypothetical protein A2Y40_06565 [Candidatus Margulisbacteria bacterium GWF2_35_9]
MCSSNTLNRLYLSITDDCNLSCKHCFRGSNHNDQKDLKTDEIKKIIGNVRDSVLSKQISLTGGEPFMRDDIIEILEYAYSCNVNVDLSTNGLLLNNDILEKLVKFDNIFYMQISVDGITKPSYEFIRGANTYERLIKVLSELHSSEFLKQIDLMMIFLVTPQNIPEIVNIPEFANQYGFDKVVLGEILPFGNGNENYQQLDISPYMETIYENIRIAREKSKIPILDQFHFSFLYTGENEITPCTAKQGKIMVIEPNGNILACPYEPKLSFGNIRDYDFDIRSAYQDIRKKSVTYFQVVPSSSNKCIYYNECQGGCPILAIKNKGECDSRCKKMKA